MLIMLVVGVDGCSVQCCEGFHGSVCCRERPAVSSQLNPSLESSMQGLMGETCPSTVVERCVLPAQCHRLSFKCVHPTVLSILSQTSVCSCYTRAGSFFRSSTKP